MNASFIARRPALIAFSVQVLAAVFAWLIWLAGIQLAGWRPSPLTLAFMQGGLAAGIGRVAGLSLWWLPINLLFVPGLVAVAGQALPAWVPLLGFVLLLLLNWNAFGERVPLYLTGTGTERALGDWLAQLPPGFAFIDLGSGLAGTLVRLSRRFPEGQFVGVETAPLTFALSWVRCLPRRNCRVRLLSLWRVDLGSYDAVYCFLSPAPMPALWDKARGEMRPGAWLISNSFEVPDIAPEQCLSLDDWRRSRLLFWRPGCAAGRPDAKQVSG